MRICVERKPQLQATWSIGFKKCLLFTAFIKKKKKENIIQYLSRGDMQMRWLCFHHGIYFLTKYLLSSLRMNMCVGANLPIWVWVLCCFFFSFKWSSSANTQVCAGSGYWIFISARTVECTSLTCEWILKMVRVKEIFVFCSHSTLILNSKTFRALWIRIQNHYLIRAYPDMQHSSFWSKGVIYFETQSRRWSYSVLKQQEALGKW